MSTATTSGMAFGYARVSTTQQDEARQRDALEAAGVDRMYVDHASGAIDSRPALDGMRGQLHPGDTVVIW
jgi:DNA invertase Pin-like site-specific DNA recombinase